VFFFFFRCIPPDVTLVISRDADSEVINEKPNLNE